MVDSSRDHVTIEKKGPAVSDFDRLGWDSENESIMAGVQPARRGAPLLKKQWDK